MSSLEEAIYACAFVDAFKEMFNDLPLSERTRKAKSEAEFVLGWYMKPDSSSETPETR